MDRIYNEQDQWGQKKWDDLSDGHFDKDDEVPVLTRAEIEEIARKKGIKLTEDDIQRMLNGDPEALAKLKLTDKEKDELRKKGKMKKRGKKGKGKKKPLTKGELEKKIAELKKKNGGKLTKDQLKRLLAEGNLTPEEMRALARANGIKLTAKDLEDIEKMKKKNFGGDSDDEDGLHSPGKKGKGP